MHYTAYTWQRVLAYLRLEDFASFHSFTATPGSVTNSVMCPQALHFT
jgi:hypothetical protein